MLLQNIDALISNHKNHSLVQIITPEKLTRFQSIILGFDAYEDEMLLGGIYPFPDAETLQTIVDHEFWVQCSYRDQFYNLRVKTNEILASSDLISVRILDSQITQDRRWSPRVEFKSLTGPKVELLPIYGDIERGEVKNLSYHGALLEFFGIDLRQNLRDEKFVNLRILLSPQLVIDTKVKIKQCFFRRKPCRHSGLRITFSHINDLDRLHIREFVELTSMQSAA